MWNYVPYDELYHHGIKGMKWGVRRYQRKDGSLTKAGQRRLARLEEKQAKLDAAKAALSGGKSKSADSDKAKESISENQKPKKVSDFSDAELKSVLNRLNMEKQYRDLMKDLYPQKKSEVTSFVKDVLEKSGKDIATQTSAFVLGTAVNKIAKSAFNIDDMVDPKKIQKVKK